MYSATAIMFIAAFLNSGIGLNTADFTSCCFAKPCTEIGTYCNYYLIPYIFGTCQCNKNCLGTNVCCSGYSCDPNHLCNCDKRCDKPCDDTTVCGVAEYCYDHECCRPCEDDIGDDCSCGGDKGSAAPP